ncbi:MAG: DoxX family protein [Rhodobacterales bacterium]
MHSTAVSQPPVSGLIHTAARIVIGSFFIGKAVGLVADPNGMGQYLILGVTPPYLLWSNIAFECVAAISIMIGLQTRLSAGLLALYLFWSSYILNYTPGNIDAISAFWRDLALNGGLLLLISHGRGGYSVDNVLNDRDLAAKHLVVPVLQGEVIEYATFEPYPAQ